ncbi:DUF6531 domain-containing protein [Streptomyces sp. NPDC058308]|uniref:DUF6531 domain-containing protein n=1 Tax=Streptomyces sp. NPDC058308 TaxID=3346440 RepID=UPI0036EC15EB
MTAKERRAQVAGIRTHAQPGTMTVGPKGEKRVYSGKTKRMVSPLGLPAPAPKSASAAAAPPAPKKFRPVPISYISFPLEWGGMRWDNPDAVSKWSHHIAFYRASDNVQLSETCFRGSESYPTGTYYNSQYDKMSLDEEYYIKVAVSKEPAADTTTGWDCAKNWSAEAKSPAMPPQPRHITLPGAEQTGCACTDTTGRPSILGHMGDPVNTSTGDLAETALDAKVQAPGVPISLGRIYNSGNRTAGALGPGWSFPYDARLTVSGTNVTFTSDTGVQAKYTQQATGTYQPSSKGVRSALSGSASDGFKLTLPDGGTLAFNGSGRLTSWKDRSEHGIELSYNTAGLSGITDAVGRTAKVDTDPATHLLRRVELPTGQSVEYGYTEGRLTSVKGTDGRTTGYGYEAGRLASITDAAGRKVMQTFYDDEGQVSRQVDAEGRETTFDRSVYQSSFTDGRSGIWTDLYSGSLLTARIDPFGKFTSLLYDDALRVIAVVDAEGHRTKLTYDAAGNLKSRTQGPLTQKWTYYDDGTIKTSTDGRGATTTYSYDAKKQLKEESGPSGKNTYTYDSVGNIKSVTSPRGKATTYDYDAEGNLKAETSPSGAKTTYTYDAAGRQKTVTDPRGNAEGADPKKYTTTSTYTSEGWLETVTDGAGHVTSNTYDANGNLKTVTDPAKRVTTYEYDAFNRVKVTTGPEGGRTLTGYDVAGNLASVTDPSGAKTTYTYDAANRLATTTSPRGNAEGADPKKYTTTYGYDDTGNLTTVVDPTGAKTVTGYDALNRPTTVTDPLKGVTETKYDNNGNVKEIIDALKKSTLFTYKPNDLLETVTNPLGKVTRYDYDADGNRTSITSPLGHKHSSTYDADGQLETETEARGNEPGADPKKFTTTYKYDLAGNLRQLTDPLGHTQKFTHDELNQQRTATNQNGETTRTDYDVLGRIETVTAPDGGATTYTYDAAGNIKTRTDDNKHTTTYGYDGSSHLKSITDPMGRQTSFGYDTDGNRETVTNARGVTSSTLHDPLGRPTSTTYTDDTPDVTVTYDDLGNRKKVVDGTGTRTFTYDPLNRLKTASVPGQAKGFVYDYNDGGQLTSRTLPHGRSTAYTYDSDGNRQTAKTGAATTTYGYDPAGRLTSTTLPSTNGYTETRTFDAIGRATSIASARGSTTLSRWKATLDAAGQPKRIDSQHKSKAESLYYTYDSAGRLKSECASPTQADTCPTEAPATTYTYDKVGNRQTRTTPRGTTTYTYDGADQLTKAATGSSATDYGYDKDGNQTTAGARTYAYDADNRLTGMTAGGKSWGFTYDADGNRTQRTKTGVTLAWDINNTLPQLAAEYTSTGTPFADYQYTPTEEIESEHRTVSGTDSAYYYHRDLVGSITDLTTATGTQAKTYAYTSAFGTGGPGIDTGQPGNNFGYAGQYKEPVGGEDAGLADALGYNMRARTYTPDQGRFTGRDPYTPGQQTPAGSPYTYTENRPTYLYDPAGTCSWTSFGGDKSCWTKDIPGTEWIPLSPVIDKIGDSYQNTCQKGSDYAKANGRSGWSGCIDEYTGVGPIRRGVDSYQQGDIANGTMQCLGGVGQFGLFLMPGPKVPVASSNSLAAAVGNLRWGAGGGGVTMRGLSYKTPQTPDLVKLINPLNGGQNCRACSVAVDSTLSGAPASAMNIQAGTVARIEKFYPGRRFRPSNLSRIVEEIARGGNGARGIVVGTKGRQGHAFNVVNVGGDVVFLDGQTGHASHIKYWRNFTFMRTR